MALIPKPLGFGFRFREVRRLGGVFAFSLGEGLPRLGIFWVSLAWFRVLIQGTGYRRGLEFFDGLSCGVSSWCGLGLEFTEVKLQSP